MNPWLMFALIAAGNLTAYMIGRLEGVRMAREEIRDTATKWLRKYYPTGAAPSVAQNDIDVMGQTLETLIRIIDKSLKRTENRHGK